MKELVTANQAALLTGLTRRHVSRKIRSGEYTSEVVPSAKQAGKTITLVAVDSLPVDAQARYYDAHPDKRPDPSSSPPEHRAPRSRPGSPTPQKKMAPQEALAWYHKLPAEQRAVIDHRFDILTAWTDGKPDRGAQTQALRDHCAAHDITLGQFYAWHRRYEAEGLPGLADKRFGVSRSKLDQEHKDYIISLIKQNPDRRDARIHDYLVQRFPDLGLCSRSISFFIKKWKTQNHELFTWWRNPDQWRSNYQVAFGSQSQKAHHFLHYVEVDSTPADVMCSDGKRYTLTGAIDIYSRKPKVVVAESSNSRGIATLIRKVILDWGVPENIVRDNGMDFTSNHVNRVMADLGIQAVTAAPFTPEAKPHIERFFRTLSSGLFEEIDGYIGHNVAGRKAIEARRSMAKRLMGAGSDPITLSISAPELQRLVDRWVDAIYNQRDHGGIGTTPEIKAAQSPVVAKTLDDERALDILLQSTHTCVVQKKGIKFEGAWYFHAHLHGFVKDRVEIRRDPECAGLLYVFALDGEYICQAYSDQLMETDTAEYAKARKRQAKRVREQSRAVEKLSENPMMDLLGEREDAPQVVGLNRKRKLSRKQVERVKEAAERAVGKKPDRLKSVAELMAEQDGTDYTPSKDPLDWMDGVDIFKIVNEG